MEQKVIDHLCHKHSLILRKNNVKENESLNCYGCGESVSNLESAYVCTKQRCRDANRIILHKKCGELPTQISHPKHPHPLHLYNFHGMRYHKCNLCRRYLDEVLGYHCPSCDFDLDITCEKLGIDALLGEKTLLQHASHSDHPLTLMRKHPFSFYCDGCGARDVDMAYICTTCQLWFHKACVLLPLILPVNRKYHHHQLVLAFSFPDKYRYHEFRYKCDVCGEGFDRTCWLYYCGDCRFFAHIKCVTSTKRELHIDTNADNNDSDVIQFPLCVIDIYKELITPFVMREKGLKKTSDIKPMPRIVLTLPKTTSTYSFLFNYHKHPLSLVLELSHEEIEEEEELKICDVCATPISSPPYYQCGPCNYFIHSICHSLPNTIGPSSILKYAYDSIKYSLSNPYSPSSSESPHLCGDSCPKTFDELHRYKLYTSSKSTDTDRGLYRCELCYKLTNGMVYECEACKKRIDVKCVSLPTTIEHASHSHHKPLIMTRISPENVGGWYRCHCCAAKLYNRVAYCCNNYKCNFALDIECVMLPSSIRNDEWDKHSLLLTFDASQDHPSDFFCNFCEQELHPKKWMYHCRQCDTSAHLQCYKAASGWYRNIKFGRQFRLDDDIHPHPLTFNCITLKKRCDICHKDVYDFFGLECESCYFVMCIDCTSEVLNKMFS